jgi:serine/threonine protein kinase
LDKILAEAEQIDQQKLQLALSADSPASRKLGYVQERTTPSLPPLDAPIDPRPRPVPQRTTFGPPSLYSSTSPLAALQERAQRALKEREGGEASDSSGISAQFVAPTHTSAQNNIYPGQPGVQRPNGVLQDRVIHNPPSQIVSTPPFSPPQRASRRKQSPSPSRRSRPDTLFSPPQISVDVSQPLTNLEDSFYTSFQPNTHEEQATYSTIGKSNTLPSQPSVAQNMGDSYTLTSPKSVECETPEVIAKKCGLNTVHAEYAQIEQGLFTVINFLGQGSMGFVEEVCVPDSSQKFVHFVRKRVQMPHHLRKKRLEIVRHEAATMKKLHHPHIIKIIGTYQDGSTRGQLFYSLLMFPVGQGDLKTLLEMEDEVSQRDRSTWFPGWFRCLSSALAYMHANGVRHQDIKPSNIIHRGKDVYFTDFSSASTFAVGQTTSTENPARTSYMYAAPEVLESSGEFVRHGRGTDVFALGAVFCEMLATLMNYSAEQFHQFLLNENQSSSNHATKGLLYGKSTPSIDHFFHIPEIHSAETRFYRSCLRNALAMNRDDRPDAAEFARNIKADSNLLATRCACDDLVALNT